jgi:hypothetical protein
MHDFSTTSKRDFAIKKSCWFFFIKKYVWILI